MRNYTQDRLGSLRVRNGLNPRRSVFLDVVENNFAVNHDAR